MDTLTELDYGVIIDEPFVCKGYSMTGNNVYGDLITYNHLECDSESALAIYNYPNGRPSVHYLYDENKWVYDLQGVGYTADDTNKLRTIIIETAQTVSAEFYNWAITGGNLVKQ